MKLISAYCFDWWMQKKEAIEEIERFCQEFAIKPRLINSGLETLGTTPLQFGCKLAELVNRPQLNLENLSEIIPQLKEVLNRPINRQAEIREAAEVRMKYKGYIERERMVADKMHRLENSWTFQLRRTTRTLYRSTSETDQDTTRDFGTSQSHSRRLSQRHQCDVGTDGALMFHVKQLTSNKLITH